MSTAKSYTLTFADGKRCTFIDPFAEPMDVLESSLKAIFKDGYLVSIIEGLVDEGSETKQ